MPSDPMREEACRPPRTVVLGDVLLEETLDALARLTGCAPRCVPLVMGRPDPGGIVDADILLVSPGTILDVRLLSACPGLRYIGICGTSFDNIPVAEARERGIAVTNVRDYGDDPAAEFIFMQLTALARGVNTHQWKPYPTELMGKTIGIVGMGALGGAIAELALAYKMTLIYASRNEKPHLTRRGALFTPLHALLAASDIVVLTTPTNLTVLGPAEFECLRHGSILVQASTGSVIDRNAFVRWIGADGNFAIFDGAAGVDNLDVYSRHRGVIVSMMVSAFSREAQQRLGRDVVVNLRRHLANAALADEQNQGA